VTTDPEWLSLPRTVAMADSAWAWRHRRCGHVHAERYSDGAECRGCLRDVDPADVQHYKLINLTGTVLAAPPAGVPDDQRARLIANAERAARVLPGPVGEAIARELRTWEDFGYRFGSGGLMEHLMSDLEKREIAADQKDRKDEQQHEQHP
jgi:hypothetical protein